MKIMMLLRGNEIFLTKIMLPVFLSCKSALCYYEIKKRKITQYQAILLSLVWEFL